MSTRQFEAHTLVNAKTKNVNQLPFELTYRFRFLLQTAITSTNSNCSQKSKCICIRERNYCTVCLRLEIYHCGTRDLSIQDKVFGSKAMCSSQASGRGTEVRHKKNSRQSLGWGTSDQVVFLEEQTTGEAKRIGLLFLVFLCIRNTLKIWQRFKIIVCLRSNPKYH